MSRVCPEDRDVQIGPRGGSYYIENGKKVYCKKTEKKVIKKEKNPIKKEKKPVIKPSPKRVVKPNPKKTEIRKRVQRDQYLKRKRSNNL